jgi:hypothetical protein
VSGGKDNKEVSFLKNRNVSALLLCADVLFGIGACGAAIGLAESQGKRLYLWSYLILLFVSLSLMFVLYSVYKKRGSIKIAVTKDGFEYRNRNMDRDLYLFSDIQSISIRHVFLKGVCAYFVFKTPREKDFFLKGYAFKVDADVYSLLKETGVKLEVDSQAEKRHKKIFR